MSVFLAHTVDCEWCGDPILPGEPAVCDEDGGYWHPDCVAAAEAEE